MKQKAIVVAIYALLILVGGIIGHAIANSMTSLIASSLIAILLFICSAFIMKGHLWAYHTVTALSALLLLFFTYRYFLSYKIAPGGIMAAISGILLIYLIAQRKS